MPSLSVQYDLANDLMAYASYTEGFKSGWLRRALEQPDVAAGGRLHGAGRARGLRACDGCRQLRVQGREV
jgi:hypothetical protein